MRKYKTGLLQVLENQWCEKEDVELQVPTCVHSDVAESNSGTDAALNPLLFKKRPTLRGAIRSTLPRLVTSSANSLGVQWDTGRPEASGDSHATATR